MFKKYICERETPQAIYLLIISIDRVNHWLSNDIGQIHIV